MTKIEITVYHGNSLIKTFQFSPGDKWTAGRKPENKIVLGEDTKISRTHLYFEYIDLGLKIKDKGKLIRASIGGIELSEQETVVSTDSFQELTLGNYRLLISPTEAKIEVESSMTIVQQDDLNAFVVIKDPRFPKSPETIRLTSDITIAGRENGIQLKIDDQRISRQHFKISRDRLLGQYSISDLGSAVGTQVNGSNIAPGEEVPLQSGDKIKIFDFEIEFLLKNSKIEEAMRNIVVIEQNPLTPQYQPLQQLPAVTYETPPQADWQHHQQSEPYYPDEEPEGSGFNRKKILIGAVVVVIGMVLIKEIFLSQPKTLKPDTPVVESPFDKLSPEDKAYVEQTYTVSENYFRQGKFSNALDEIRKVRDKIKVYKESEMIHNASLEGITRMKELEEAEQRRQEEEQLRAKVQALIVECKPLVADGAIESEVRSCLIEAIRLDPENLVMKQMLADARATEEAKQVAAANAKERRRLAGLGEKLFNSAVGIMKKGKVKKAIEAFESHISSKYPDPKGLKSKSKEYIGQLQSKIDAEVGTALSEAKAKTDSGDLKGAIERIRRARQFEPNITALIAEEQKLVAELEKQMRVLYQESVIEEGLGNIEAAKERWDKILSKDVGNGEYFKKATLKMKKYGG